MKKYILFFILLGVVILVAYEALIFYDTNFRYGRMWETPAVRPHEEPPLGMQGGVVPFGGGEEVFKATPVEALKSPLSSADPDVLKLGKASYSLYCSQCHGKGYDGNGTGAAVGHDVWSPESAYYGRSITETEDVHGGYQAMPLYYDNTVTPYYSETQRTWNTAQDWTVHGVTDLTLYVRGQADNAIAPLYVAIEDGAGHLGVVTHPNAAIATAKSWSQWKIPLSDFTGAGVTLTAIKKMYIGVGNRNTPTAGGAGVAYIDDIRLTKPDATAAP